MPEETKVVEAETVNETEERYLILHSFRNDKGVNQWYVWVPGNASGGITMLTQEEVKVIVEGVGVEHIIIKVKLPK